MTHVLGRVFLAATLLLLPLWRGDRLGTAQAKRGGANMVEAATSTLTTKKTKDVQLGEVIQIGGSKFVKIGTNHWQAVKPYTCADPVLTYAGASKNFDYTGGEQTYAAYAGCQYKLEVWGAQGGGGDYGGKGGYAVGVYHAISNRFLYLAIGGAGGANSSRGYNGGGSGNVSAYSGGGATHIALISGVLQNLSSYRNTGGTNISNEILIVAGAGGGRQQYNYQAGNGGGINGSNGAGTVYPGLGGTQTGSSGSWNNPDIIGTFGAGGSAETCNNCNSSARAGGGGGGWYGGSGGGWSGSGNSVDRAGCGGGGSGYIGSSNLISAAGITRHMTCYNCTTSTVDATRTQSNTCVNATATADCSKTGNGYARITRLN